MLVYMWQFRDFKTTQIEQRETYYNNEKQQK